jgi:uncharacterized protein with von Willebrand factor type A (vWA) domain
MSTDRSETPLAPLLRELDRISQSLQLDRPCSCQETIEALQQELSKLRMAVAHLRASRLDVPKSLRPVVARALLDNEASLSGEVMRPFERDRWAPPSA